MAAIIARIPVHLVTNYEREITNYEESLPDFKADSLSGADRLCVE
jgi:hypothetical protein